MREYTVLLQCVAYAQATSQAAAEAAIAKELAGDGDACCQTYDWRVVRRAGRRVMRRIRPGRTQRRRVPAALR